VSNLAEIYRMNEVNLDLRRQFISLNKSEINTLKQIDAWMKWSSKKIAREFYEFQFSFASTRQFFQQQANRKGVSLEKLRSVLEDAQAGYLHSITQEAAKGGSYGASYFETRLHIGMLHNKIDLPPKWYIGSYSLFTDLIRKNLRKSYFFRPLFRARVERVMAIMFNYDMQAVVDAFLLDLFTSYGVDLTNVDVASVNLDLTDGIGGIKSIVRDALVSIVQTAAEVDSASREISSAAETVSQSVQEQGATLEETTASLEEISKIAKDNVESAHKASRLAAATDANKSSSSKGIKSETSAVESMEQISDASRKITDIISVIDGIAFQTNLLALNAAVEAARAGEQGRGFAVVATEVRELAQRSATAAKEIKGLIEDTATKVEEGSTSVKRLADMITAMSTVSEQQAHEINELSSALGQINKATQLNSAQSEELSATSERLTAQSNGLFQTASQFKFDEGASSVNQAADLNSINLTFKERPAKRIMRGRKKVA